MHAPRMTTRRWMMVVLLAAALAGSYVHAELWYWRAEIAAALRSEHTYLTRYDEGRVTACKYFEASERLMRAQVARSRNRTERRAAEAAALDRSVRVLENEQRLLCGGLHEGSVVDVAEAAQYVDDLLARLGMPPLPGPQVKR